MLIMNELNNTVLLDNLYDPIISSDFWVMDLNIFDYTLTRLCMIEEATTPVFLVNIGVVNFIVPTSWYVMVFDDETSQIDAVSFSELTGKDHTVLVSNSNSLQPTGINMRIIDYKSSDKIVYPTLLKHQMLCHPIYEQMWINISPNDVYNRYLKNKFIGDLLE